MYLYSETGILVDKISYEHIALKYGKPIEISENGLLVLFSKGLEDQEIHLIQIHINRLEHVSSINIKKRIINYFDAMDRSNPERRPMLEFWNEHL